MPLQEIKMKKIVNSLERSLWRSPGNRRSAGRKLTGLSVGRPFPLGATLPRDEVFVAGAPYGSKYALKDKNRGLGMGLEPFALPCGYKFFVCDKYCVFPEKILYSPYSPLSSAGRILKKIPLLLIIRIFHGWTRKDGK